jgi:hypothetical protein
MLIHGNGKPSSLEMVRRDAESHDPLKLPASLPCFPFFPWSGFLPVRAAGSPTASLPVDLFAAWREPALRRAKVPVKWTDLTVRHTGYVDKALRARKIDRDTKILRAELVDRPNDPFVLFNLGAIAAERRA